MSDHIAEVWRAFEDAVRMVALDRPALDFTCIRDVYGRSSVRVEGADETARADGVATLIRMIEARALPSPFLAQPVVAALDASSGLGELIRTMRRPDPDASNVFVIERLLVNQSWVDDPPDGDERGEAPVVAFYSFKGGVGRSTLAASAALEAARQGKSVALVDLDLEAPGIERFFFGVDGGEQPEIRAGVVDYLLERRLVGEMYSPDFADFVVPYTEPAIEAKGGRLVIVPAGKLDATYVERLGRVEIGPTGRETENPIRRLLEELQAWRAVDLVVVDCRTGFTEVGGVTLNGLSTVDVLVFKAGPADRLHLPTVLSHITRFRADGDCSLERAEALARSFLIVYTMAEWAAKESEAREEMTELRRYTSEACWNHIFERFGACGYVYPEVDAEDTPLEAVPHDFVTVPYYRDWARTGSVTDIVRLQRTLPDGPLDALVRRLLDVKLRAAEEDDATGMAGSEQRDRSLALQGVVDVVGQPTAEQEFQTVDDLRDKFLPRAAHRPLLEPSAFVVLGRKGSGKSALFQLLLHPAYLEEVASHIGLDETWAKQTRWVDGLDERLQRDDFVDAHDEAGGDLDRIIRFWRAVAAWRIAQVRGEPITGLETIRHCIGAMDDRAMRDRVDGFLASTNNALSAESGWICLCYDRLDVDLTRNPAKRGKLLSGMLVAWQEITKRWGRLRTKIFLREDIWDREIDFDDKAKVRDGIDRARITWDHVDLYRTVIKRLARNAGVRQMLDDTQLWAPRFDAQLDSGVGFMPPMDEEWVRGAVETVAGAMMGQGEWGHKKGYVYPWLVKHTTDAQDVLRPRNLLLLFSEAAKLQSSPASSSRLISAGSIRNALRGEVSRMAVADLRDEFREEWTAAGAWLPDTLSELAKVWPVSEDEIETHLRDLGVDEPSAMLDRMVAGGLFERRRRSNPAGIELQIPDIYLYGLGLTRRGG